MAENSSDFLAEFFRLLYKSCEDGQFPQPLLEML
jgi:hypothetical protein